MEREKAHIKVIVIGHYNSGKSTITGHLIYNCGDVDKQKMRELENNEFQEEMGKGCSKYASLLNQLKAERDGGLAIIDIALWKFETPEHHVKILDGNKELIKNWNFCKSIPDCALLVVSAGTGDVDARIDKDRQTREHALLAFALGVKQLIVCVNKMDITEPPYSEVRFEEIKRKVGRLVVGYDPATVAFVPVSGWTGDNVFDVSENMPWFTGSRAVVRASGGGEAVGRYLIEALDAERTIGRPAGRALRFVPSRVTVERETVPPAPVEPRVFRTKPGSAVVSDAPADVTTEVESEEMRREAVAGGAVPGQDVFYDAETASIQKADVTTEVESEEMRREAVAGGAVPRQDVFYDAETASVRVLMDREYAAGDPENDPAGSDDPIQKGITQSTFDKRY